MNEVESKAEVVRKSRERFHHTWAQILPKLTVYGLVDETVGQLVKKRRSKALVSAVAVAGAAWLFNTFQVSRNFFKFTKSKTPRIKTGE
ncbi:MAG TPA: hypothetical protein VIJ49_04020 [Aestuariivirga sp.]